jgi:integrase
MAQKLDQVHRATYTDVSRAVVGEISYSRTSLIELIVRRARVRVSQSVNDNQDTADIEDRAHADTQCGVVSPQSGDGDSASTVESWVQSGGDEVPVPQPTATRCTPPFTGGHRDATSEVAGRHIDRCRDATPTPDDATARQWLDPTADDAGRDHPQPGDLHDNRDEDPHTAAAFARGGFLLDARAGGARAAHAAGADAAAGPLGVPAGQDGAHDGDADGMTLALAVPLRPAEVPPLAALLGVRDLPPQHAILAAPTADARIDVRALEIEALRLRYGDAVDPAQLLGDRAEATYALQSAEATKFVRWLAGEGRTFPPTVPDLVRHLHHLADRGILYSGIRRARYGVEALCRAAGVAEHLSHHRLVSQTMRTIARNHGRAARHQKAALLPDHLRAALPYLEELAHTEPVRAARDLALAAWGIATAMRGDEIVHARLEQLREHPRGMTYAMRHGKMLQAADDEAVVTIGRVPDARICPVETYRRYAELARLDAPGTLFRKVARDGSSKREGVSHGEIATAVKAIAVAAGLDPRDISTHSLRIGAANAARRAGLGRDEIKRITRHRDDHVLDGYMRPDAEAFANDLTGALFA